MAETTPKIAPRAEVRKDAVKPDDKAKTVVIDPPNIDKSGPQGNSGINIGAVGLNAHPDEIAVLPREVPEAAKPEKGRYLLNDYGDSIESDHLGASKSPVRPGEMPVVGMPVIGSTSSIKTEDIIANQTPAETPQLGGAKQADGTPDRSS